MVCWRTEIPSRCIGKSYTIMNVVTQMKFSTAISTCTNTKIFIKTFREEAEITIIAVMNKGGVCRRRYTCSVPADLVKVDWSTMVTISFTIRTKWCYKSPWIGSNPRLKRYSLKNMLYLGGKEHNKTEPQLHNYVYVKSSLQTSILEEVKCSILGQHSEVQ